MARSIQEDQLRVLTRVPQRLSRIAATVAVFVGVLAIAVQLTAPAVPARADHDPGTFFLQTIDIATGDVTDVGSNSLGKTSAIAFDLTAGTLYAVDGAGRDCTSHSSLYTLDPATGAVVATVGSTGYYHVTGLAVHPTTGVIYATANGDTASCFDFANALLLTLDPATGAATLIGNTGEQIPDMAFDSSGVLYAWSENTDDLYTIDLTDASATLVGESNTGTLQTGVAVDSSDVIYMKSGAELYMINASSGEGTFEVALSSETSNILAFNSSDVLYTGTRDTSGASTNIQVGVGQANPTTVSPVVFDVTFTEPVTGFDETDVDLSLSSATTGAVIVTDTGDAMHFTVSVAVTAVGTVTAFIPEDVAVDRAGHGNSGSGLASIEFDDEAPVFDSLTVKVRGPKAIVAFSASDHTSLSFECKIDTGSFMPCASGAVFELAKGQHTVTVKATDAVNNSTEEQAVFTIKSGKIKP